MILAQRQGKRCTASLAIAGARFLPGKPAHEVWAWLQDPVLIPSYNRPPEWPAFVEDHVIEIAVPATYHRADVSSGLLGTTIVLPSGACVKIRLPDGCGAGQVVAICVPKAALQGQPDVMAVDLFAQAEAEAYGTPMPTVGSARLGPMGLEELEEHAPLILPSDVPPSLQGGGQLCICCHEPLEGGHPTAACIHAHMYTCAS